MNGVTELKYVFLLFFTTSSFSFEYDQESERNLVAPLFFGSLAIATVFNSGKTPRATRNFWLYGALTSGFFIEEPIKNCLLGTSLGMVAINQYYLDNAERSEREAGRGNLLGLSLGLMSPLVFESCESEAPNQSDGLSILPTFGEPGIQLNWKVSF